jgi:hypothetical protein
VIICRRGFFGGLFERDKVMINIRTGGIENYCKQLRKKTEKASML